MIHEVVFRFDDQSMRHKALMVLMEEVRLLELAHNDLDARIEAAIAELNQLQPNVVQALKILRGKL